jgi:hypothetical protein
MHMQHSQLHIATRNEQTMQNQDWQSLASAAADPAAGVRFIRTAKQQLLLLL